MIKRILIALACLLPSIAIIGQTSKTLINANWQYYETPSATPPTESNSATTVDLPHSWNATDAVDATPGYRRGTSWYVKDLDITATSDERIFLYVEGANITSEIWLNDQKIGGHVGGYLGYEVEMTEKLQQGSNKLAIRVDNSIDRSIIPSQKSDFFVYGGITRDVYLLRSHKTRISHCLISTPNVSQSAATTSLDLEVDGPTTKNYQVRTTISSDGVEVVNTAQQVDNKSLKINLPPIDQPKLWSPDRPHLYDCRIDLMDGDRLVDTYTHKVGYRYYRFEPNGAFYLNGERLKLRGTHRHEEHAGYGPAVPDSLHYTDMAQVKEMGANFIRLAHYPQDPTVYRACDELGLIVWDELPWCRGGVGDEAWQANTTRLLKQQILQNYNHARVLFWSLGNEMYWLPDYDDGDNRDKISTYLQSLHDLTKELDPQRYTAVRKYYAGSDIVDVFSPSIWSGWYAGAYTNYEATLTENRMKYQRFLHMEYGGSSHVGRHVEVPVADLQGLDGSNWAEVVHQSQIVSIAKSGDWTESYMVDLFDWYLHISENTDWFAGSAQWAFKDFGTPLRPENSIPYMNQKGLIDRAGKPKDSYYVFKSYWSTDPFVWIESPTWTHRFGSKGDTLQQCIYSNAGEVELFVNGRSLGKKSRNSTAFPAQGLSWAVVFDEGSNSLEAVAYIDGKVVDKASHPITYQAPDWGKPNKIVLSAESMEDDHYLVTAMMTDQDGQRVFDYEERVYFDLSGSGELIVNLGTPTGSQTIDFANGIAKIKVKTAGAPCTIEARNQNFKGSYLTITP